MRNAIIYIIRIHSYYGIYPSIHILCLPLFNKLLSHRVREKFLLNKREKKRNRARELFTVVKVKGRSFLFLRIEYW